MKPRLRMSLALATLAMATALAAAGYAVWRANRDTQPSSPHVYVDARFKTIRESPGHVKHIQDHKLECAECHDLHGPEFDAPDATLCARCHPDVRATVHDSLLARTATDCLGCHTFGEDWTIRPQNCTRCHASGQGFVSAIVQHGKEACTGCHRPHQEPSLVPKPCVECHETEAARHGKKVPGAMLCLDCHRSHDSSTAADTRCAECHARSKPTVPLTATFSGHKKCVTCHRPHDFRRRQTKPCAQCHTDTPVLARAKAAEHQACNQCHQPHQVRRPDLRNQCVRCHRAQIGDHPVLDDPTSTAPVSDAGAAAMKMGHLSQSRAETCLDCHPIHELGEGGPIARSCTTCHKQAASDTEAHAGGLACTGCHRPHRFALRGESLCATCHSAQSSKANRGHRRCADCHKSAAHTPRAPRPECRSCHEPQHLTAPEAHRRCTTCHDSHSGAQRPGVTCVSCHADRAGPPHGRANTCTTCHRAHGPRGLVVPPPCERCHKRADRGGLHKHKDHTPCTACHAVHEPAPRSDRATCATCHKGMQQHEPAATSCIGCHPFRK